MKRPFVLGAAVLAVAVVAGNSTLIPARSVEDAKPSDGRRSDRFEVWIADQSDTRPGFGGQLLISTAKTSWAAVPGRPHLPCVSISAPTRRISVAPRPAETPCVRT